MLQAFFVMFVLLFGMKANADTSKQVESKIYKLVLKEDYKSIGQLLQKNLGKKINWTKLREVSLETESVPLLKAMDTTSLILKTCKAKMNCADLLQTALFIEASLPKHMKRGKYYFPKSHDSHPYAVECDPKTGNVYVVLQDKANFIGSGRKKTVSKAILYDRTSPEVHARAVQTIPMERELKMTKLLMGLPGICDFRAITKHKKNKTTYHTIYSKLYTPGALRASLNAKNKLSFFEKAKIALDILKGLDSLHSRGIVHRDLGARNYFVNIPSGKTGKRDISACIADFGRTTYATDLERGDYVQGSPSYVPPEGLDRNRLRKSDYFRTDVYAVGCVFYEMFYGKTFPWHDKPYFKGTKKDLKSRHSRYLKCLKRATEPKLKKLKVKSELSIKQRFERMVLSMLDKDPKARPKAAALLDEMLVIYQDAGHFARL